MTLKAFLIFAQVDSQQAAQVKLFLLFLHLNNAQTSHSSSQPRKGDPGDASDESSQTSPHRWRSAPICPLVSALGKARKYGKTSRPVLFIYPSAEAFSRGPSAIMFLLTLHLHFLLRYLAWRL